jgi:glycosyltransferase involved in cell wall biosynthesis/Flp pilus assembly protein TadD
MLEHLLIGPLDSARARLLQSLPSGSRCLVFGEDPLLSIASSSSWEDFARRFPAERQPEAVLLCLGLTSLPNWIWSAPLPIVGLLDPDATSPSAWLPLARACDAVFAPPSTAELCRRAGVAAVETVLPVPGESPLAEPDGSLTAPDLDLLVVLPNRGNSGRILAPWLDVLLSLVPDLRWHVQSFDSSGVEMPHSARARIVLSLDPTAHALTLAAAAVHAGSLFVQGVANPDLLGCLRPGLECLTCTPQTLAPLLARYRSDESGRADLVRAARDRLREFTPSRYWETVLARLDEYREELTERACAREVVPAAELLQSRLWLTAEQSIGTDPTLGDALAEALVVEPQNPALHHGLALLEGREAATTPAAALRAAEVFRRALACDSGHLLASAGLAEALRLAGRDREAVEQARAALGLLNGSLPPSLFSLPPFCPGDAAFLHDWAQAGTAEEEGQTKLALLRTRLHLLLAALTGDLADHYEALLAQPANATARAALGCALARAGRLDAALSHLRLAAASDPFDAAAARAFSQALLTTGTALEHRRLARRQRRLAAAAPAFLASEEWFANAAPVGDELVSLLVTVRGEEPALGLSLETLLGRTRPPFELFLLDLSGADSVAALLADTARRPEPVRVVVLRPDRPSRSAACNEALREARGAYVAFLDGSVAVASGWLDDLFTLLLCDWPQIGLVGPVSNQAAPPQHVDVVCPSAEAIDQAAARQRRARIGQAAEVPRLDGSCVLAHREALQAAGPLDESLDAGFLAFDDLCFRARDNGSRLFVALGVFVYHLGTPEPSGTTADEEMAAAFARFRDRWGPERTAAYNFSRPHPASPAGAFPVPADMESLTAEADRPLCSLCMIVRNEAEYLARCLESAAGLFEDVVVVVDSRSTDRTREVALGAGARVVEAAWEDSFATARNVSVRHARGRWIFWLDADEYLDAENRERLRHLLARLPATPVGYLMRQFSPLEGSPEAAAYVDQLRLFPNHPHVRWRYRVHEQILPALREIGGEVCTTDIVIHHEGFVEPAAQGAKVDRNLRLLEIEHRERPDDPFILYNLGAVALTQGRLDEARGYLEGSLAHSHPQDSLVRKLFALLTRTLHLLGRRDEALAVSRRGLDAVPGDGELLFWQAVLHKEAGRWAEAEDCLLQLLQSPALAHLTSVDAGLYSYRSRHLLAEIYLEQERWLEAEAQCRAILAEHPRFLPAWMHRAEVALRLGRWADLEEAIRHLEADAHAANEACLFRARGCLARQEFEAARQALAPVIARAPRAIAPLLLLSYAYLQEGRDWAGAERALRDILALDPDHAEARHNLQVLLNRHSAALAAVPASTAPNARTPGVSLCMIVRNEERNLPDCLGSVADLVNEIVVVDTGSVDDTREVAARFGARVYEFPWCDNFAAARNESLRHATGDWVFWMDADDRLDHDNRARLRRLLASLGDENTAFVMKCLCLPDPETQTSTVVDHVRLFRRDPRLRWRFRIHEQILPALRELHYDVRRSDVVVHHTGYQDAATRSRKRERDLRLLQLELADDPDNPFTHFNLGAVHQEQGRWALALAAFRRSLDGSQPGDSIYPKLHALLAQCHGHLGQHQEALAVSRRGLELFPEDVELLFQEGMALRNLGDWSGAVACWERVLAAPEPAYFSSMHTGIRGTLTRQNLAVVYLEQGLLKHAEAHWQTIHAEMPGHDAAWRGLTEVYLRQRRWDDLDRLAAELASDPRGDLRVAAVRARTHLARREFDHARRVLEEVMRRYPGELEPRLLLSYAYLQEGRDWTAAERALRAVLELAPDHEETRHNLQVLLNRHGHGLGSPPAPA